MRLSTLAASITRQLLFDFLGLNKLEGVGTLQHGKYEKNYFVFSTEPYIFENAAYCVKACYYSQDSDPENGSIEVNGIRIGERKSYLKASVVLKNTCRFHW